MKKALEVTPEFELAQLDKSKLTVHYKNPNEQNNPQSEPEIKA
jgi:hypothetical protein